MSIPCSSRNRRVDRPPRPGCAGKRGSGGLFSGTPNGRPLRYAGGGELSTSTSSSPSSTARSGRTARCKTVRAWPRRRSWVRDARLRPSRWTRPSPRRCCALRGLPVLPALTLFPETWGADRRAVSEEAAAKIGYPLFVKPSSSGSSVGVHLVEKPDELQDAVADAFRFDSKA